MSRRLAALLGGLALAVTACSIQPDTAPREIPVDDRGLLEPVAAEGGERAGTTRVYFVGDTDEGEPRLRAVPRDVDATPMDALQELLKGTNDQEAEIGLRTSLPPELTLLSARMVAGTLQVDVTDEILDLPAPALQLAVAEIVFTASELDRVRDVRLRVDGQSRAWPDGSGELTTAPLTVYDYPGLAESTQPAYPPIPSEQPAA
jgi:spore germination protein GerM